MLIGHSYGGVLLNESVPEALTLRERKKIGKAGGVRHRVLYASMALPLGVSWLGVRGVDALPEFRDDVRLAFPAFPHPHPLYIHLEVGNGETNAT